MNTEAAILSEMIEKLKKQEGRLAEQVKWVRRKRRQVEKTLHTLNQMEMPLEKPTDPDAE